MFGGRDRPPYKAKTNTKPTQYRPTPHRFAGRNHAAPTMWGKHHTTHTRAAVCGGVKTPPYHVRYTPHQTVNARFAGVPYPPRLTFWQNVL